MERHGLIVNVRPDRRDEYLALHRAVWPQVEQTLRDAGVSNYTIFVIDETLMAYYEYAGSDHDADMARIAEDPVTQEWWTHTDPCQTPFGGDGSAQGGWREATEVWHLP